MDGGINRESSAAGGGAPPRRQGVILVPLDGSAEATEALPVAQSLATLTDATVHIIHVLPHAVPIEEIRQKLHLEASHVSGAVLDQRTGSPAPVITDEAQRWHSNLIVMCSHSGADIPPGGFSQVAEQILLHTPCPIIFVPRGRGQRPWSLRRLLAPHDGSPTSAIPIGPISDLCHHTRTELTILHVSTAAAGPAEDRGVLTAPRYMDQPQHEWPAWGTEFLDRVRAMAKPPCELKLRTVLCTEEIGRAIVRFAAEQDIDLIVLAWRKHLEQERALTMRMVVEHAPCPVAVHPVTVDEER
jgi:nucleotide-binding universal stress UspA family protein